MSGDRHVGTRAIREAVRGREAEVLKALGIAWDGGASHIHCPYPDHADDHPSWRWDGSKRRAYCTCIDGSHSIVDVVMRRAGIAFDSAKVRLAEILGRQDLIGEKGSRGRQPTDAASLLRPGAEQRDDALARAYLADRLGVAPAEVRMPATPVAGWRSLPYYDPPAKKGGKPNLVGRYPGVVFGTVAPDGRAHAHRIYVKAGGAGKADLGVAADGRRRDAKKSARLPEGARAAGCAVLWGEPATAPHLILAEGAETAAALALAHAAELEAGEVALAAALSTGGMRAFRPWAVNRRVTVAADRDEGKPGTDRAFGAGERAALEFARRHQEHLDEVRIALPGAPGADVDWLDVLRADGIEAVRSAIAAAGAFVPPLRDEATGHGAEAGAPDPQQIDRALGELVERAEVDPGAPFEPAAVAALASARHAAPAAYQRTLQGLKRAGARLRDLEREVRRANLRVIEGGAAGGGFEATVEAGPYFVTPEGVVAWRKETREGVVPQPLCNFTARIVAEEVLDDGAERRTVFVIEGELPGGRPLPPTRVPAERYPAMGWVTEAWGMAPVIFAGQGKRDHLRVAIQMLSGSVPRHTVYGHLGWRKLGADWVFLHAAGGTGRGGALGDLEVQTAVERLQDYGLPAPPVSGDLRAAVRASLKLLDLAPDAIAVPVLGAAYRAPLGEAAVVDFALHLTGPTGVFKSELAALAQAHFGAAFHGKHLPAGWADTANMLEKKVFLAKDAVLVVDDFAPTGTLADVQRLHREADRLLRAVGNRAGRARMRADGGARPTYCPRGLIISTGEEIPTGQSLRARLLILEVSPGDIAVDELSAAQEVAARGVLAAAMAGYLSWLAPQMDRLKERLPARQRALRDAAARGGQHRRTPEVVASLRLAWETFVRFAEEVGALTVQEAEATLLRVEAALHSAGATQAGHQAGEEPGGRFLALLGAAIGSGRGHIADAETGLAPADALCWGWRHHLDDPTGGFRASGDRLGWLSGDQLYLDPDAAYAAAQRLAREQGTSIPITQRTLWKRLDEKGLLASTDRARGTRTARRTILGRRRDVVHLRAAALAAETDQPPPGTARTDQGRGSERRGIPGSGQFGHFGQETEQGVSQERERRATAVGWETEI